MAEASGGYELAVLLLMASRTLVEELHNQLSQAGYSDIRPAHGFAFQLLVPDGATINEIGEHLGVTKQAASQMVDYLAGKGYVSHQVHPVDKRNKLIMLTAKGWECINRVEDILSRMEQHWNELLGKERMANLRGDLRSLILEANKGSWPNKLRPSW